MPCNLCNISNEFLIQYCMCTNGWYSCCLGYADQSNGRITSNTHTHTFISIISFNANDANNDKIAWFYSFKWNFRSNHIGLKRSIFCGIFYTRELWLLLCSCAIVVLLGSVEWFHLAVGGHWKTNILLWCDWNSLIIFLW